MVEPCAVCPCCRAAPLALGLASIATAAAKARHTRAMSNLSSGRRRDLHLNRGDHRHEGADELEAVNMLAKKVWVVQNAKKAKIPSPK
uniref:Uncharacterized protein n=1 Tax=Oryza barthii TaxID=65489 RepID=A0A0D3HFB5_9ORYZ